MNKKVLILAGALFFAASPWGYAQDNAAPGTEASYPYHVVEGGDFRVANINPEYTTEEYQLAKYDVLNILVIGFPNGIGVDDITIGPDGYVQLPYAGTVKLAGLTIPEATEVLTEKLGEYIKIPSMSLFIKSYGPRKIYVMGEVRSPGIKELSADNMNVFAAITAGNGITRRGRVKHLQVLRAVGNTLYYKEVNLEAYVKKHDMTQNLALKDGDIVFVPKSNKIIFSEDVMPYVSFLRGAKYLSD